MTHEPECFFDPAESYGAGHFDCICERLRAAYERGQLDARSDDLWRAYGLECVKRGHLEGTYVAEDKFDAGTAYALDRSREVVEALLPHYETSLCCMAAIEEAMDEIDELRGES